MSGDLYQEKLHDKESVDKQAAEIVRKGKLAALEKNQEPLDLPTTDQVAEKLVKDAAKKLAATDDPLSSVAQSAAAKGGSTPVAEAVRARVAEELGDRKAQDRVAAALLGAVQERLARMPYDKVKERFADPSRSSHDIAKDLLREGKRELTNQALEHKDIEPGVPGSGVEKGSDVALAMSAVDRAREGKLTPAAASAVNSLVKQIDEARARAKADVSAAAS